MSRNILLTVLLFVTGLSSAFGQVKLGIGDDNTQKQSTSATKSWNYSEVKGVVIDSLTRTPIQSALVSVLAPNMAVRHSTTDTKGRFSFKYLPKKDLKIEITCLGYKIFAAWPESNSAILDLGKIVLGVDVQQIDAVTVKTRMSFFTIKGDTIIYNPKAVRTLEGDMAADILRKMPGIEVKGESVSIMGEEVRRTYVNGRPIYGQLGNKAINHVEAKNVAGIKAYDEIDVEEYERSGQIKKKKAIDILTFDLFSQDVSGDAFINYGADTDKGMDGRHQQRYAGGGGFRFFTEKRQLELDATTNNTGLDRQDYTIGNNTIVRSYGQDKPTGYNRNTKANLAYTYNRPMEQVKITLPDGKTVMQNKMGSMAKIQYSYSNDYSRQLSATNRIYFPTKEYASRLEGDTSLNRTSGRVHTVSFTHMAPSKKISNILADINFSNGRSYSDATSLNLTDGKPVNRTRSLSNADQKMFGAKFNMDYSLFRTKTHSLGGSADMQFGNNNDHGWRIDTLQSSSQRLDVTTPASGHNLSVSTRLTYSYNMGKHSNMDFSYAIRYRNDRLKSYSADRFTGIVDTTLSRDYTANQVTQSAQLTWRYNSPGYKLQYYLTITPKLTLMGRDEFFPENRPENRTFFFPDIRTELSKGAFRISYSLGSNTPSLDQLRNQLDTRNPLWLTAGNPDLKSGSTHLFSLHYSKMDYKTQQELSWGITAGLSRNLAVQQLTYYPEGKQEPEYDYTIQSGATLKRWVNVNGAYNLNAFIRCSRPIPFLKSMFKGVLKAGYSKSPVPVGDRIDFTKGFTPEATLSLTTNFSPKFEAMLNTRTGYRNSRNASGNTDHNILEQANVSFRYNPHTKIFFNGSYEFFYNRSSFTPASTIRNHILDATLGCRFLKNNAGNLSVTIYDILNRNKNLTTTMDALYIQQNWRQISGRYFTVNLSFKLNYKK